MLEILFSIFLIIICVVCVINLFLTGSSMYSYDPMGPVIWPVALCLLLIVLLSVNTIRAYKKWKTNNQQQSSSTAFSLKSLTRSKLFLGIVTMLLYGILLEKIGFLWSTPFFLLAYMSILGQKKLSIKIITAIIATIVLYLLFNGLLQVPLPRGYGIFRNMSLTVELLIG